MVVGRRRWQAVEVRGAAVTRMEVTWTVYSWREYCGGNGEGARDESS
jgi:hypothetical protein